MYKWSGVVGICSGCIYLYSNICLQMLSIWLMIYTLNYAFYA
jgi:hypothetical protein